MSTTSNTVIDTLSQWLTDQGIDHTIERGEITLADLIDPGYWLTIEPREDVVVVSLCTPDGACGTNYDDRDLDLNDPKFFDQLQASLADLVSLLTKLDRNS
jgi:hypothetical protein